MSQIMPCIPAYKRYTIIKEYVTVETYEQLALRCGCTRRTIDRDIATMKKTGEWWQFLEQAMFRYGRSTDIADEVKFKEYAKLYGKQFIPIKTDTVVSGGNTPLVVKMWMPDSDESTADDSDTV